ncbi:prevent-host-death protein [Rhizobium sp. 18065]|uniref:prevent-host-death protein n=1 Tax=Rhizobium sp. 18065 TaxID=2681411 RepID=UPI001356BD04|nr:prevent-host-death protein [Rhizobium sp. 18065]
MTSPVNPSVLQDEEFQAAAKSVLREGETVADLIDHSARAEVEHRLVQAEFITRGLAALKKVQETGVSHSAEEVHAEMRAMLEAKSAGHHR